MDARARAARLGDDAEQSRHRAERLGERESGTARLEEAVAAFRAALTERTRERVPLDWATTQNNLGIALSSLGERESGTARLEEAVAAFRAALTERTRERVPYYWAQTQENLAIAFRVLATRTAGDARLAVSERRACGRGRRARNLSRGQRHVLHREGGTAARPHPGRNATDASAASLNSAPLFAIPAKAGLHLSAPRILQSGSRLPPGPRPGVPDRRMG